MSELGDVLELMHGARHRFRAVRATVRQWDHLERRQRAFERSAEERGATLFAAAPPGREPPPETRETIIRLFHEKPARVREEIEGDVGGPSLGVRDGNRWWMYDAHSGAISNEGDPDVGSGVGERLAHLLDPAGLIGALEFDPPARTVFRGRPAFRVRARPRALDEASPLSHHALFRLGDGADEYELLVDRERGVLLGTAARADGDDFSVVDVLEMAFDETFPPGTFAFTPPPGEEVRTVSELARPRAVTLEEAATLAPFPIWVPRRLPFGWEALVHYVPPEERPRSPASVSIHYSRDDAAHQLNVTEMAADDDDPFDDFPWEPLARGGDELRIWAPEEPGVRGETRVQVERDGTRITLTSGDLDLDTLLGLADSLVRAPVEPPGFE